MQVRLGRGAWAVAHGDDVHLGVLRGDMDEGWRAHVEVLTGRVLPGIIRRLNLGGVWGDGEMFLSVADDAARLEFSDGTVLDLDQSAAARLQVFCTNVRHGTLRPTPQPTTSTEVAPSRGVLRVTDVRVTGHPLARGSVHAGRDGNVHLHAPTTAGPLWLGLPALPVLVAAVEAGRDDSALEVMLDGLHSSSAVLRVSAAQAAQAAAEAQWLMPAIARRINTPRHR